MNITSVTSISSDSLLSQLETNGLSTAKAQLVENDLSQVSDSATSSGSGPVDMATMRAALDKKIDDDVASGTLSSSDAAAVKKTLDQIEGQTGPAAGTDQTQTTTGTATGTDQAQSGDQTQAAVTSSASSGGTAGASGGSGGGGSAAKTEVSETETINGPLMTTVITYSDGSTETLVTVATEADEQKYGKPSAQAAANTMAANYLSTLQPGTLVNQLV